MGGIVAHWATTTSIRATVGVLESIELRATQFRFSSNECGAAFRTTTVNPGNDNNLPTYQITHLQNFCDVHH